VEWLPCCDFDSVPRRQGFHRIISTAVSSSKMFFYQVPPRKTEKVSKSGPMIYSLLRKSGTKMRQIVDCQFVTNSVEFQSKSTISMKGSSVFSVPFKKHLFTSDLLTVALYPFPRLQASLRHRVPPTGLHMFLLATTHTPFVSLRLTPSSSPVCRSGHTAPHHARPRPPTGAALTLPHAAAVLAAQAADAARSTRTRPLPCIALLACRY
jgi:hypothetical protein